MNSSYNNWLKGQHQFLFASFIWGNAVLCFSVWLSASYWKKFTYNMNVIILLVAKLQSGKFGRDAKCNEDIGAGKCNYWNLTAIDGKGNKPSVTFVDTSPNVISFSHRKIGLNHKSFWEGYNLYICLWNWMLRYDHSEENCCRAVDPWFWNGIFILFCILFYLQQAGRK